jgi:hypothetical protein
VLLYQITGSFYTLVFPGTGLLISWIYHFSIAASRTHRPSLAQGVRFFLVWGIALFLILSVCFNNVSIEYKIKAVLILFHITLFGLLVPSFYNRNEKNSIISLCKNNFIYMAVVLICVSGYWWFAGLSESNRFGEPFSPGVFGTYMLIALLIITEANKKKYLMVLFFIFIVLSQSRANLLGVVLCMAIFSLNSYRRFAKLFLIGCCVIFLLAVFIAQGWQPAFVKSRTDISSGRFMIWSKILQDIKSNPILGYGLPPQVSKVDAKGNERIVGAHNSFLDLAYTYGLVFSILAYLIIFILIGEAVHQYGGIRHPLGRFLLALFVFLLFKSLVTNTFWTNMADAASIFIVYILCLSVPKRSCHLSSRKLKFGKERMSEG